MKKDTNFIIIDMDDVSVIIVISFDLYKGYFVLYPISTQRSSSSTRVKSPIGFGGLVLVLIVNLKFCGCLPLCVVHSIPSKGQQQHRKDTGTHTREHTDTDR